jgi:hypothetical protein
MDEDLASMSREQLIDEVKKLRRGIRTHRDSTGQELSAGITRRCGAFCLRGKTHSRSYRIGRNSSEGV